MVKLGLFGVLAGLVPNGRSHGGYDEEGRKRDPEKPFGCAFEPCHAATMRTKRARCQHPFWLLEPPPRQKCGPVHENVIVIYSVNGVMAVL